jgi:hypothetical protein
MSLGSRVELHTLEKSGDTTKKFHCHLSLETKKLGRPSQDFKSRKGIQVLQYKKRVEWQKD